MADAPLCLLGVGADGRSCWCAVVWNRAARGAHRSSTGVLEEGDISISKLGMSMSGRPASSTGSSVVPISGPHTAPPAASGPRPGNASPRGVRLALLAAADKAAWALPLTLEPCFQSLETILAGGYPV